MANEKAMERQARVGIRPTLLVGLGGTGQKVLVQLKARFIQNYEGVPNAVEFLAFDTDQAVEETMTYGKRISLTRDTELVNIGGVETAEIVRHLDKYPAIANWMSEDKERFPRRAVVMGAQQVRSLGRMAFFWHVGNVYDRLESAISRLTHMDQETEERGINVFIISSLCGGTGAGIFLDMAYLIRQVVKQSGIQSAFCYVNGILVLPSVFPNVDPQGIESNAFASLVELDFMMDNAYWNVDYGTARVSEVRFDAQRPFNICYLIDAKNEQGQGLQGLEEIAPMISEAVYLQVSNQVGKANASAFDNVHSLGQMAVNVATDDQKPTAYSSFGTASLIYPAEKIVEYSANRLGHEIISDDLLDEDVNHESLNNALEAFTQRNQLDVDQILDDMSRDAEGRVKTITLNPRALDKISNKELQAAVHAYCNQAESKVENDLSQLIDANQESLRQSVVLALSAEIERLLDDVKYGLRFTLEFLTRLDQWSKQTRDLLSAHRDELEKRRDRSQSALKERQRDFADSFGGFPVGRGRRINQARDTYISVYQVHLQARHEARRYDAVIAVLAALSTSSQAKRNQVQNLVDRLRFIQVQFQTRFDRLLATGNDHILTREITDQSDIENGYETYINKMPSKPLASLLETKGPLSSWLDLSQEDIAGGILEYTRNTFAEIYDNSVEQIILNKDTEDQGRKRLEDLKKRSVPFWSYKRAGVLESEWKAEEIMVVGVQEIETSIYKDTLKRGQQLTSTFAPHEIVVLQTKHGLPLFALTQYEQFREAHDRVIQRNIKPLYILPEVRPGGHKAKQMFALGLAFGFVFKTGVYYYLLPKNEVDPPIQLGQGMSDSLQFFRSNDEYISEVERKINNLVTREGSASAGKTVEMFIDTPYVMERKGGIAATEKEMERDSSIGNMKSSVYDLVVDLQKALQSYLRDVLRG